MKITNGNIGLTRKELDKLKKRGYIIDEHTPHYMNHIKARCGDCTIGLYNWLDGLEVYSGDKRLKIETKEQAEKLFSAMDALIELSTSLKL
ncbi:MAG: hypothetical protein PHC28_06715 [Flavobacterium sp.]|uniref:hypothetical protein n=1 Tax=Flavobacterium sp. TaxID=239 RepID=UPI0026340451|nr:hypothetical protein [Flavobacterium sp.]MDD5150162.1 hypothetical protein [Flavobacterium sp.]